jgi:glycosyltransferase involved in cell wall biosynthesis
VSCGGGVRGQRKVVIVVDNAPARTWRVRKIASALKQGGYSVKVAHPRGLESLDEFPNVPIRSLSRPSLVHYVVFTLCLFFYLVRDPPDAVHFVNLPDMAVVGVAMARKFRRFRFVYDRRSALGLIVEHRHKYWGLLAKAVESFAFARADAIVIVVPAFQRELQRYEGKLVLVPNGVTLADFRPRRFSPRKEPIVLMVTALTYIEGVNIFIKAAKIIHDMGVSADFVVVGDGEYAPELHKLNRELHGPVRFTGWIPFEKVPEVMSGAQVCVSCVLPTRFTNYARPLKLFEYLASRKPVVVSNIPGHLQVVHHLKECMVYDANDPNDLAHKILRLLRDAKLRQRLAINGYKVAENYSWETSTATLLRFYDSILL